MAIPIAALAAVPALVAVAFLVHWAGLRPVRSAAERLPLCRGAYLGLSAQLVGYAWLLFGLRNGPGAALAAAAMTCSFAGDFFNLQFPALSRRVKQPLSLGILSFAVAQACYIAAFLQAAPLGVLVSDGALLIVLGVLIVVPAALFRIGVWDPARPRSVMLGAFGYGFVLGAMAAVALSAALALGGAWIVVAAGAGFFLLSDAIMGQTTIKGRHPVSEFQIPWFTYLVAQGLILLGLHLVGA